MRLTTIIHPRIQYSPTARPVTMSDYIAVPVINTYGTWSMHELIKPEQKAQLAFLARRLERETKK